LLKSFIVDDGYTGEESNVERQLLSDCAITNKFEFRRLKKMRVGKICCLSISKLRNLVELQLERKKKKGKQTVFLVL
jgi:hypothetical protein